MKIKLPFLLCIILVFLLLFTINCGVKKGVYVKEKPTFNTPNENDKNLEFTLKKVEKQSINEDTIIIAVDEDWFPYSRKSENGEVEGFDVDVLKAIMEEAGLKYKFVPYLWATALADLKVGVVHMLPMMNISPDRIKVYFFTNSYAKTEEVLFVHKNNTDIKGETEEEIIKSLEGKTVSVQSGVSMYEKLRVYKEINLVTELNDIISLKNLNDGKVDAVPVDKFFGLYCAKKYNLSIKIAFSLSEEPYQTGVYKNIDSNIIIRYNEALGRIKSNGIFDDIFEKWFGN